jgi:hypothetical protein
MGFFDREIGPVFMKESSQGSEFIEKMQALSEKAEGNLKKEIETQINLAHYGEQGEKTIIFELKNSGMDMYVLRDICLEYGDMTAQIDFIVITRKVILVIECKNLVGDIEIDSRGAFIRNYKFFGKKIREGIYSPITQNERHMLAIKETRKDSKGSMLTRHFFEKYFIDSYKSIVVLANPKTCLYAKYAKKEVKEQVIRADQLIHHIQKLNEEYDGRESSEKQMREIAEFFLSKDVPNRSDYTEKYEKMLKKVEEENAEKHPQNNNDIQETKELEESPVIEEKTCPRCSHKLVLRIAKKGKYIGNQFYGCSNYPKCKYIENLS